MQSSEQQKDSLVEFDAAIAQLKWAIEQEIVRVAIANTNLTESLIGDGPAERELLETQRIKLEASISGCNATSFAIREAEQRLFTAYRNLANAAIGELVTVSGALQLALRHLKEHIAERDRAAREALQKADAVALEARRASEVSWNPPAQRRGERS